MESRGGWAETLLKQVPWPAAAADGDLRLFAVNDLARSEYGASELRTCREVFGGTDCAEGCPARRALEGGVSCEREETMVGADGKTRRQVVRAEPMLGESGRPEGVALSVRPAGVPWAQTDGSVAQGPFVGSITHALKGLLNGLEGGVYMVDSGRRLNHPSRAEAGLTMLRRNLNRAKTMVGNILYYARDREIQAEVIALEEAVASALKAAKPSAEAAGVELSGAVAPGSVTADRAALSALLVNLLESAVDCSSHVVGAVVTLEAQVRGDWAVFEVRHGGTALEEGTLEGALGLIYVPAGADRSGLWIYAARRIVSAHGGELEAWEAGRRFVVRLPRAGQ